MEKLYNWVGGIGVTSYEMILHGNAYGHLVQIFCVSVYSLLLTLSLLPTISIGGRLTKRKGTLTNRVPCVKYQCVLFRMFYLDVRFP